MPETLRIIDACPARQTKLLASEKISFYVEAICPDGLPAHDICIEIWTNCSCSEAQHHNLENGFFAARLHLKKRENNILFFERTLCPLVAGFYQYSVRFRHKSEEMWKWYMPDGDGRDIMFYVEPQAVPKLIVYNAFVRQFGARDWNNDGVIEPGEGGTFNDILSAMAHFRMLGINAIYLNPIHKSGEMFRYPDEVHNLTKLFRDELNVLPLHMHPGSVYSIQDYKSIDPELGINRLDNTTDQYQEFKRFVHECHKNKIAVFIDLVLDHTSKDSVLQRMHPEWYLYKQNPLSLDDPYIYPEDDPSGRVWGKPKHVFSPYHHGIFWSDCAALNWNFRYPKSPNPAKPNPSIREMREYFKDLMKYFVKTYGVDGFRLDVAYAVPPDFWHEAIAEVRHFAQGLVGEGTAPLSPEITFIGETYVDDVYQLQACGMTAINGDFSAKTSTVIQLKGYLDYIYNISGSFFPLGSVWLLFPECHDFYRLPKKEAHRLKNENSDTQLNKSRWVLASTLPGIPLLHNGYEVVEHEQLSVRSYTPINWNSKKNISQYIGRVNKIRSSHISLQKGAYTFVPTEQGVTADAQLFCFIRDYQGAQSRETFLIVINMDFNNKADSVKISLPDIPGVDFDRQYALLDHLTGERYERVGNILTIILDPGESHIFEILR